MRQLFLIFFLFSCCSCAVTKLGQEDSSQLVVEVKNASKVKMDPDVEQRSRALHHFLVGSLEYNQEDFAGALKNLNMASKLATDPAPLVHSKLAELSVRSGQLDQALAESKLALEQDPENLSVILLHAGILESLKRYDEAAPIYLRAIELKPDTFDSYILLSSLYFNNKEYDKALAILRRYAALKPKDSLAYYYIGRTYELMGDLPAAEREFQTAFKLSSDNASVVVDVVRVMLKEKKITQARDFCAKFLEKNPNNALVRKVMGELLIGENKLDDALKNLQIADSVEDNSTDTKFKIALILMEKQKFDEAARELNLVLATKPEHTLARYYLASIYASTGRKKEAVDELYKIDSKDSMFVKARTFASFILRQDGKLQEAEEAIRAALDQDDAEKSITSYLVLILRDEGKHEDAEEVLRNALEKDPNNEKLLMNLGVVLDDLKRPNESVEVMQRILAINPKNGDALNYIAYYHAEKLVDLDRGIELAKMALEVKPNDGYYLDTLGWLYFRKGDFKSAKEQLSRAVELVSNDIVIAEHFGDALFKLGEVKQAFQVYDSAQKKFAQDETLMKDKENAASLERIKVKISNIISQDPSIQSPSPDLGIMSPRK